VIQTNTEKRRWAAYVAWGTLAVAIVLMVGGGVLWEVTETSADGTPSENLLTGLAFLSFPAMGALIASRRPGNRPKYRCGFDPRGIANDWTTN